MYIRNSTQGTVVAEQVRTADSFWRRLKGLLGTHCLSQGLGLVIKPCNSVHTFGMGYPIDVLFVDHNHYLIKIVENMMPSRVSMKLGSSYVVELPAGTVAQTRCFVGDKLEF